MTTPIVPHHNSLLKEVPHCISIGQHAWSMHVLRSSRVTLHRNPSRPHSFTSPCSLLDHRYTIDFSATVEPSKLLRYHEGPPWFVPRAVISKMAPWDAISAIVGIIGVVLTIIGMVHMKWIDKKLKAWFEFVKAYFGQSSSAHIETDRGSST
jgi:hypothetical protein